MPRVSSQGFAFPRSEAHRGDKAARTGTPIAVVSQILGWSASTAVRMSKRYGHIRPEVQRQALATLATAEIQPDVNQIVHHAEREVESRLAD